MINAYLNINYADSSTLPQAYYREYNSGVWNKYIPTVVMFSKNEWPGYTSLPIPSVVWYIPSGTIFTLGLGDNPCGSVGAATSMMVTKLKG